MQPHLAGVNRHGLSHETFEIAAQTDAFHTDQSFLCQHRPEHTKLNKRRSKKYSNDELSSVQSRKKPLKRKLLFCNLASTKKVQAGQTELRK